jgi:hypothetical protein
MGESFSFHLRGLFDSGRVKVASTDPAKQEEERKQALAERERADRAKAMERAALVRKDSSANPLRDDKAPMHLGVFYDGQRVDYVLRDGKALILEPRTGQKVVPRLTRKDPPPCASVSCSWLTARTRSIASA